jgi:nitrate reductase NapE component
VNAVALFGVKNAIKNVSLNVIVMRMKMETKRLDFKTKLAAVFLGTIILAMAIGLITIFIVEPTAMIPVAFVGFFGLIIWAINIISDYYADR